MRNIVRAGGVALLGSTLVGCGEDLSGPGDPETVEGIVQWADAPDAGASMTLDEDAVVAGEPVPAGAMTGRIEAPDTVEAGESFEATFVTIGANGCWEADSLELEVEVEGLTGEAVAYDRLPEDHQACPQALVELPRSETLAFDEPGEATLRLTGRRVEGSERADAGTANVEVSVTVVGEAAGASHGAPSSFAD